MLRSAQTILALTASVCLGMNLPGVVPRQYEDGARVNLKVSRIDSVKTQLPFDYYSLPFCKPDSISNAAENLGEVLRGDRIENSPYELNMNHDVSCRVLCEKKLSKDEAALFHERISEDYRVHWIVDNLPAATRVEKDYSTEGDGQEYSYERGFPLGFKNGDSTYINNHVSILIKHRTSVDNTYSGNRIVGVEVKPSSVGHKYISKDSHGVPVITSCPKHRISRKQPPAAVVEGLSVVFTYDVKWEESDIRWAQRWDLYLTDVDANIHWFSIINSLVVVLLFSFVIAVIMCRTLNTDISTYNALALDEEEEDSLKEETGWKLVHGDVFRPPVNFNLLSVLVGTGCQLYTCSFIVLAVALSGLLAPANRGMLGTVVLVVFALCGYFGGVGGSTLYKTLRGTEWKTNVALVAFFYPTICAGIFFFLNLFVWAQGSSAAIPFQHMLLMLFLWVGISVPLVGLGAYHGLRRKPIELPCTPHQIPRFIPESGWSSSAGAVGVILLGGLTCFVPVFIEVFFIMSSIWLHHYSYMFGFLTLVFIILSITCSEVAIVACYCQLTSEDYNWWWRSFLVTGSSAFYIFLYSIYYFNTALDLTNFVSCMLYFGYMGVAAFSFFIMTGTVGVLSCLWFTTKIYGAIKID